MQQLLYSVSHLHSLFNFIASERSHLNSNGVGFDLVTYSESLFSHTPFVFERIVWLNKQRTMQCINEVLPSAHHSR